MILVVGGTGLLGARVVELLVQAGQTVRCLVRARTADDALRSQGVEVVRGDLTDHASLPAACAGVETVVTTATVIARRLAGRSASVYPRGRRGRYGGADCCG